jgi:hypothetical protein
MQNAISGQELFDMASFRLAGYSNFPQPAMLMSFLNEAKDEVWSILKNLNADYYIQQTQFTDNTQTNYFGAMSTTVRQYTLPQDFREMHLFVVLDPAYAQVKFIYKHLQDRDFREAYMGANAAENATSSTPGVNTGDNSATPMIEYLYTIIGHDQLLLAQYPEYAFQFPQIFYVRNMPDFDIDTYLDETVLPFSKKIADYAVMRVLLSAQDQEQFEEWRKVWKDDILMIASSAGPRNQADAEYVDDFLG